MQTFTQAIRVATTELASFHASYARRKQHAKDEEDGLAQNLSSKREQLERLQESHVLFDQLLHTAFAPYLANNRTHLQHHAVHLRHRSIAILEHYEKYLQVAIETVEFFRKRMKRTSNELHVSEVRTHERATTTRFARALALVLAC